MFVRPVISIIAIVGSFPLTNSTCRFVPEIVKVQIFDLRALSQAGERYAKRVWTRPLVEDPWLTLGMQPLYFYDLLASGQQNNSILRFECFWQPQLATVSSNIDPARNQTISAHASPFLNAKPITALQSSIRVNVCAASIPAS